MKAHESILVDVSDNLVKGFADAPDKDSQQSSHEKIEGALDFINHKISADPETKKEFVVNAKNITQRSHYSRHYKIEMYASVMSTLVQVFPLLGILGTILAIAQTAFQTEGNLDVSSLSNAFVLAMDTTILGIGFSVIFMVIESTFQPKIERVINESADYKDIVSKIHLS
jgi:biopolymer transport protein ExbB/TolQ